MRHRLVLRVLALVGLSLVCVLFPVVGENRFWLAALLLALTTVPVLLPRLVPSQHWMLAQSIFDVFSTALLIGFVPDVWAAGLVIVVCSPAASAALLGRRIYVSLEVLGLFGVGLAAALTDVAGWEVPLAVAVLMVPLVASYVDVFFAQELTASARLDDVANSSFAVFWEVDATTGDVLQVSGQIERVLGHTADSLPTNLPQMLADDDQQRWWDAALHGADDHFVLECQTQSGTGQTIWLRFHARRLLLRGEPVLRGIAFDITELAQSQAEIRRRAEIDDLTGLKNRFMLVEQLRSGLRSGRKLALFVIDLDRFKDINDTLGHLAGDEYLQIMAERLQSALDPGVVARMGGDEFAAVVPVAGGLDGITEQADRFVSACSVPVELAGIEFAGSASCGVAIAPLHGDTAEDLLRRADLAMYAAKRSGTGFHVFDYGNDEKDANHLRLSGEAETALTSDQFRLWFQPKVDLETGSIVGAEALLRWHHPERGVLNPVDFLDIIELSRHRETLCKTVVGQGVDFLARSTSISESFSVAVNISLRDLTDPGFVDLVTSCLERADVAPGRLTLEITERDLMDDRSGFLLAAEAVRTIGAKLSIDDFGTGHSSLLRLHQLPVTELKIDRSFVTQLCAADPQAEIITNSILDLGRSLGHQVVAEGIEQWAEVERLRSMGCHLGQGYLYSPAVPAEDFMDLVRTSTWNAPSTATST